MAGTIRLAATQVKRHHIVQMPRAWVDRDAATTRMLAVVIAPATLEVATAALMFTAFGLTGPNPQLIPNSDVSSTDHQSAQQVYAILPLTQVQVTKLGVRKAQDTEDASVYRHRA